MNIRPLYAAALAATMFFCAHTMAQVKVGDNPTTINPNAVLDIESTNKGILLPRVVLTATNAAAPLSAHVAGMTVYNTATAGTAPNNVVPAIYYNDGTKWIKVNSMEAEFTYVTLTNPTAVVNNPPSWYDYMFQTESNDVMNEYNPATGRFTAARTGFYIITVSHLGSCTTGPFDYTVFIDINGLTYAGSSYHQANAIGGNFTSFVTLPVRLNAGSVVYSRGFGQASSCNLAAAESRTFMTIMRVR